MLLTVGGPAPTLRPTAWMPRFFRWLRIQSCTTTAPDHDELCPSQVARQRVDPRTSTAIAVPECLAPTSPRAFAHCGLLQSRHVLLETRVHPELSCQANEYCTNSGRVGGHARVSRVLLRAAVREADMNVARQRPRLWHGRAVCKTLCRPPGQRMLRPRVPIPQLSPGYHCLEAVAGPARCPTPTSNARGRIRLQPLGLGRLRDAFQHQPIAPLAARAGHSVPWTYSCLTALRGCLPPSGTSGALNGQCYSTLFARAVPQRGVSAKACEYVPF